jgi:hypothetical protein
MIPMSISFQRSLLTILNTTYINRCELIQGIEVGLFNA